MLPLFSDLAIGEVATLSQRSTLSLIRLVAVARVFTAVDQSLLRLILHVVELLIHKPG